MTPKRRAPQLSFEDALDLALDAIARGEKIDDVLAAHPRLASRLRPLLEAASEATAVVPPPATRLVARFSVLRDALHRERTIRAIRPSAQPRREKRLPLASLSLPASLYAMIFVAALSGAAGATVGMGPANVVPEFVAGLVGGGRQDAVAPGLEDSGANGGGTGAGDETPVTPGDGSVAAGVPENTSPVLITLTGRANALGSDTFTLTSGENAWTVSYNDETSIQGTLSEGAVVTLDGYATGTSDVYATTITVSGGDDDAPQPTSTRPASNRPHTSTPQPQATSTPQPTATDEPEPTPTSDGKGKKTPGPPNR